VTDESAAEFNALPEDWASDPALMAGLTVDDDDEHDDPVLRWPDGRVVDTWREDYPYDEKMTRDQYEYLKRPLQVELVKLQNWVKSVGEHIVIVFEGRDAAGKGGTIKRFTEHLNPRGATVVALDKPTERNRPSGTSSGTYRICPRRARSSCSTARGTTGQASSG
jgi:polyphosphate kinase 2 (PPK2 family)